MNKKILTLLAVGTALSCGTLRAASDSRPNVVVLLADDLGYGDLSIHGATDVKTPHIDALAKSGTQFNEAYVCYPACGPSRAGIMTGRHHLRFGFQSNPDQVVPTAPGNLIGLPSEEPTLAELMKKQGYATALIGKWHLGIIPECHPCNRGFDEFYGFLNSCYRYFDLGNAKPPYGIMRNFEHVHEEEYLTDAFAREGEDFIKRHQDDPFFLFVSFNAVHTPLMFDEDPGDVKIPLNGTDDVKENRRMLVNMIEGLDRGVGRIMKQLKRCGLEEDTLVFFLSDNGGAEATGAYSNGPLRDYKGTCYEGGIRVPFFVSQPGTVQAGKECSVPVSALDLVATSIEAAGGTLPTDRVYDSVSLLSGLTGEAAMPARPLFWAGFGMPTVRLGDWKLIVRNKKAPELYNIRKDIGETTNLADAHPERVADMKKMIKSWQAELPPLKFRWLPLPQYKAWMAEHGEQE